MRFRSTPGASSRPPRLMISCARCAPRCWCWGRCWRAAARRGCRCPAAAPSARGRSICTSRGWSAWARTIELRQGYIEAEAREGLRGAEIVFPIVSVGATENLLMAATLADGETMLVNAAREPEIVDLAACLNAMGAKISTAPALAASRSAASSGCTARTTRSIPDRIETGTYLMAAAIAGGAVELVGARYDMVGAVARSLEGAGVEIAESADGAYGLSPQRAARRRRRDDRALSRLPDRSPGPDDGADDHRRRARR